MLQRSLLPTPQRRLWQLFLAECTTVAMWPQPSAAYPVVAILQDGFM